VAAWCLDAAGQRNWVWRSNLQTSRRRSCLLATPVAGPPGPQGSRQHRSAGHSVAQRPGTGRRCRGCYPLKGARTEAFWRRLEGRGARSAGLPPPGQEPPPAPAPMSESSVRLTSLGVRSPKEPVRPSNSRSCSMRFEPPGRGSLYERRPSPQGSGYRGRQQPQPMAPAGTVTWASTAGREASPTHPDIAGSGRTAGHRAGRSLDQRGSVRP